jgi:peptidoglycan/LPS O-acetylase OafA/YrhL
MPDPEHSPRAQTTSAVSALLAAWLIVSPWLLGIPSGTLERPSIDFALNFVVIGALVLAASAMRLNLEKTTPFNWLEAILGAWLIITPWMFGYDTGDVQTWNCIAVGVVIAGMAIFSLASSAIRHAGAPRSPTAERSKHVNH